MHGGHHVAQKFNTTTCPLNWLSVTVRSESRTVKSGAAIPMRDGCDPLQQPDSAAVASRITMRKAGATAPANRVKQKMRRTQL